MTHDEFRMLYELPPELKVEKTRQVVFIADLEKEWSLLRKY